MSIWQDAARVITLMSNIFDKLTYINSVIIRSFERYDPTYLKLDPHTEFILFEAGLPRYAFDLMVASTGVKSGKLTLIGLFEHIRRRLLLKNVSLETIMRVTTSCHSEIILYLDMAVENIHRNNPGTMDSDDINQIVLNYFWFMDVYDIKCATLTDSMMKFLNIVNYDKEFVPILQMMFNKYTISSCVTTQLCSKIQCKKILEKLISIKSILFVTFCAIVHEELGLLFKLSDLIIITDLGLFLDACLYLVIIERECITLSDHRIGISDELKSEIRKFLAYYEIIDLRADDHYCICSDIYYARITAIINEPELAQSIDHQAGTQALEYLQPFSAAL